MLKEIKKPYMAATNVRHIQNKISLKFYHERRGYSIGK